MHVISDALITLAYLLIPILLVTVVRKRNDIPFHWMFVAFGTFILACGATHAMGIVTLWFPMYRLDGLIKAMTAVASVSTAVCLARLLPTLLKIPTAGQLEEANKNLAAAILVKDSFAQALQVSRDRLKTQLEKRTSEISQMNLALQRNIEEEKRNSKLLQERERQFKLACDFGQVETWTWDLRTGRFDTSSAEHEDGLADMDHYFAMIYPEDLQLVRHSFERAREEASDFNIEFRAMRKDGTLDWKTIRGSVERGADGQPLRITGVKIDITTRKVAERALERSVKQFEVLADAIPNLAWVANPDGAIFWYNRRWYEYTGTTPQQMEGWGWQAVHDPAHLPWVMERWRECLRTVQPFEMEFPLRSAGGSFNWFLTRVTPVLDAHGNVDRWFGTNTDVTEIRRVREALRESESHFRQITESLPALVWISDAAGVAYWHNQPWHDYTGSLPDQSLSGGWKQFFPPDSLEKMGRLWIQSGTTGADYEIEFQIRRKDGCYRWFLGRAKPVRNNDGSIAKWFHTCTDIEDYKRAEGEIRDLNESLEQRVAWRTEQLASANENLAETKARMQAILDSATGVAIIATDTERVIRVFNTGAERMLQYSADEIIGLRTPGILHSEEEWLRLSALNSILSQGAEGKEPTDQLAPDSDGECTYIRKDGSTVSVYLTLSKVRNGAGAITGFLGIATDISARKSLELQLLEKNEKLQIESKCVVEANRAKSAFLAAMSHEIRTPMNAILGMSDLLWETVLDDEQRKYVEVFRRAGESLLALINDILDLSKIEAGHFELDRIEFNLEEIIDRSVELVGQKAYSKGVGLLCRIAPDLETSRVGDPARLQQILVNLLGNAVKFTAKGQIVLSVEQRDANCIECSVADTGIGIAPEKQESIFNDFTQADSGTTRRFGGTGLGLGISRRLVSLMNGALTVESTLGVGSTFRFTAELAPGPQKTERAYGGLDDLHGRRVLVVDDNSTDCFILRETLGLWGLVSKQFHTAEKGVAELVSTSASRQPYDLIMLDRQLPDQPGFEALEAIQKAAPRTPIIILSSDLRQGDAAKCRALGVSGYAVKPVSRTDLFKLICLALETCLPEDQEKQPPTHTYLEPKDDSASALCILIAEDSPDNCALVRAYLKSTPHSITFVEDGRRAVEQFTAGHYDLILMDMQMPEMDGATATRAIRAIEKQQNRSPIPIVAITANALNRDVEASRQAGCNVHLSKPISKQKLLSAIQQYEPLKPTTGHSESIVWIQAPDGLEEVVPSYLASRRKEAQILFQLMESSEFAKIRGLAHDLKGTGAAFGFPNLTRMGARIEKSAADADVADLHQQLRDLSQYLDRVQIGLRPGVVER